MQRREFLNIFSSSEGLLIRPPYFENESLFISECINCDGKCAIACEENIIIISKDKTPLLLMQESGCTYCDECAKVCDYNVLNLENKKNIAIDVIISNNKCLSWDGVMCFSCKDPCLEDAIEFKAMFMPTINQDKCTSCGFCLAKCPTYAIEFKAENL